MTPFVGGGGEHPNLRPLTAPQLRALHFIEQTTDEEGGLFWAQAIREGAVIPLGSVRDLLGRLEAKGAIRIATVGGPGRWHLTLTPAGRKALAEA